MSKKLDEANFIGAGFKELPAEALELAHPPKIHWGKIYVEQWSPAQRLEYAEKLAAAMNHAASLIQDERNKLTELLVLKERQLEQLAQDRAASNDMIQAQITGMNADRQSYNRAIAERNSTIRRLEAELEERKQHEPMGVEVE